MAIFAAISRFCLIIALQKEDALVVTIIKIFPAMPVHAKVRPLLGTYTEDDIVDYYCEYTDMKLIGNARRKCNKSRWTGDIPQCGSIPRRTLDRIEMVNLGNHSVSNIYYSHQLYYTSNYLSEYQKQQQMTFFGQPSTPGECIHSKVKANVTSLEWRLVFKWAIGQVYHVEIVVNTANMNQALDFRKNGSIVRQPEGTPEPVEVNEKLFKYTFVCELRDQSNVQKLEDFAAIRSEELMNVTIDFGVTDVTVCELHVSETLPIRYYSRGSCGSPDIPLYSTYGPVFDETSNGFIPIGYRFTCDNGFRLDGNQVVTCVTTRASSFWRAIIRQNRLMAANIAIPAIDSHSVEVVGRV
ncbi:unnamed protein product [Oppiella nova]|uniref:Sushi domain-containing protein n=1 Tax=Oppiella nova TaxID=334625 RepID=A0A7R9MBK9_9ACAR|nr:unnamed protein product [Oppiella nova]CAG2174140.1 unnamed protein product [Oppiella nova]